MIPVVHKAFAYITHQRRLLLFRHLDFPEAGIQVPAGTIKPGEPPDAAALREAHEETGLADLILIAHLCDQQFDMTAYGKPELHHRHFYHLRCATTPPETWQHSEPDPSDPQDGEIRFAFFWANLPDGIPTLIAGHDALLPTLIAHLTNPPL